MTTPIVQRDSGDLAELHKLTAKRLRQSASSAPLAASESSPTVEAPILRDKPLSERHVAFHSVDWDALTPEFHPHPLIRAQQVAQHAATAASR